ncbi:hypothetical protein ACQ4M3_07355 [Leptolyngbya sp. AN03gr2]|uniref:hypothetical protein n=1 Tax=unclassified Leptolyngbya TaxID=2650499 RepID=UPI003D315981
MTATIHLRYEGTSRTVSANLPIPASDTEVKEAVVSLLEDVDAEKLQTYIVDRSSGGNITVRPQAVYG